MGINALLILISLIWCTYKSRIMMNQYIYKLLLLGMTLTIFQSCSYVETVQRANHNKDIKGTEAYYDEKCLVAEECAVVSAKIVIPVTDPIETLAVAVVVDDGSNKRVIDFDLVNLSTDTKKKEGYFFFNLPVGKYMVYILKESQNNTTDSNFSILAQRTTHIVSNNLKSYHNAVILDDIEIQTAVEELPFSYQLDGAMRQLEQTGKKDVGFFENNVSLDDEIFSHKIAMEGLYYPQAFSNKTKGMYRLAPKREGTIPIVFVHGMAGTPRDWSYMLEHLDLTHFTPYVVYYPTGEDFTKLSAQFNAWILSDKIFEDGPGVVVAHSFGGIIVRDASNIQEKRGEKERGLFISLATPYGGDSKASEGVTDAPYVIPSWRSIADNGTFIKELYRKKLPQDSAFHLIFAYNNSEDGPSGDGRVPLTKQLRAEAQNEAQSIRGFNEDHISILNSKESTAYVDTLLQAFVKEHLNIEQK